MTAQPRIERRRKPRGHSIQELNQLYVLDKVEFKDGKVINRTNIVRRNGMDKKIVVIGNVPFGLKELLNVKNTPIALDIKDPNPQLNIPHQNRAERRKRKKSK